MLGAPVYESKVSNSAASCVYHDKLNVAEIVKMRGNFWKTHGYFHDGLNLLYPEEALYLLEKGNITFEATVPVESEKTAGVSSDTDPVIVEVEANDIIEGAGDGAELHKPEFEDSIEKATTLLSIDKRFDFPSFYEKIVNFVSLPYYLVYSKLKSLDYIVLRHSLLPVYFSSSFEIEDLHMQTSSSSSNKVKKGGYLQRCAAFKIFLKDALWSKKQAASAKPLGYVIILEAGNLPSGQVLLQLLSEANGAPILLAQVSSTHYVSIFEFTDAELCLNLETDTPFSMGDNTATMQGVIDHAKSKRPVKKRKVPNASVGQSKCNDLRNVKSRETIITEPSIFRNAVVLNEITEVIENIICQIEGCI